MGRITKTFHAGSQLSGGPKEGLFGHGEHTAWEEFQVKVATPQYQKVIKGTAFPKRA